MVNAFSISNGPESIKSSSKLPAHSERCTVTAFQVNENYDQ